MSAHSRVTRTHPPLAIHGHVEPRFDRVRDAFAENFARGDELGAACCVYHRGRPVVDVWAGTADRASGRPWTADTAAVVFSATKGITAACLLGLVERGLLDLDAPVAAYWPAFAAAGKDRVPVRWVLSHRAGIPVVDASLTLDQVLAWEPVVAAIAAQAPVWEPGTRHGYHLRTYGWLADAGAELGFAYVMNQMQLGVTGDPRSARLIEAVYASLR